MEIDEPMEPVEVLPEFVPNIISRIGPPLKSAIKGSPSSLGEPSSSKSSDSNIARTVVFSEQICAEPNITQENLRSMGNSQTNTTQPSDLSDSPLPNIRQINPEVFVGFSRLN